MADDWETGTDITRPMPRPLSPSTLRQLYGTPDTEDEVYRPWFTCHIPENVTAMRVVPAAGPVPAAVYTLAQRAEALWVLRVSVQGKAQCEWDLVDETQDDGRNRILKAYAYTWKDDERALVTYKNVYSGEKEYGWDESFYGTIVFGHAWKEYVPLRF